MVLLCLGSYLLFRYSHIEKEIGGVKLLNNFSWISGAFLLGGVI